MTQNITTAINTILSSNSQDTTKEQSNSSISTPAKATKINLLSKNYADLEEEMLGLGEKKYRAKQIWGFIYAKGIKSFSDMTSISKPLQEKLAEIYTLDRPQITEEHKSFDGTIKYLVKFFDGKEVEMVYIPTADRGTLCISSQVGCNMGCTFCNTGTQKMVRNLTCEEMVGQVMLVKDMFNDYGKNDEHKALTNVVFMGMGEPLQNYKPVVKALQIMHHQEGLCISKRRLTVSTCGIIPNIERLAHDMPVNLSLSIHASNDELRSKIMPINNTYPLAEIIKAGNYYYKNAQVKRITLVYLLLKGVNDKPEHAQELIALGRQLPCKFNVIPFHPYNGSIYDPLEAEAMRQFANKLINAGFTTTIRTSRGDDVMEACGQLKSNSQKVKVEKANNNI